MKIKFTNPCPSGELKGSVFLNKSKIVFNTENNTEIVCPYNGVVDSVSSNQVTLKHNVNGEEWTSKLKNFKPYVGINQRVQEGRQLGYTNGDEFSFSISPSVDTEQLITHGIIYKSGGFLDGKSDSDDELGSKNTKTRGEDNILSDLLKSFLAPVSFVQGALLPKKTNEDVVKSKNNLIQEDIKKIKRLL